MDLQRTTSDEWCRMITANYIEVENSRELSVSRDGSLFSYRKVNPERRKQNA